MHSRTNRITSSVVHQCAMSWVSAAMQLKDHGWKCTAVMIWNVVLRAAARACSLSAACRDLIHGPSDQGLMDALVAGLPRTLSVLEKRLHAALTAHLPSRLKRRKWPMAIDWHLTPYYGEPARSRNEIYYGKPRQGTKKFHAYATVCIVSHGQRYTLAATWVQRHESMVKVLTRLVERIRGLQLKIQRLLLDRAFFNVPVVEFLQQQEIPFLMPVMFRGRPPKNRRQPKGLHWIKRQRAGWYSHTLKNRKRKATVKVCVSYRAHRNRRDGKRKQQKLMFAAWRVRGTPLQIREWYRKRFGIEASYRQWRQARIFTCVRSPHLRLLFFVIGLLLRNVWVWLHHTQLADRSIGHVRLRLDRLRFRRMLDWIALEVVAQLHDQSMPCVKIVV